MRRSILYFLVITFALLSKSSGKKLDEKFENYLQESEGNEDSVLSPSQSSEWTPTRVMPKWNPDHFGIEKVGNRKERRRQKKMEKRKERQERRERRKNRNHLQTQQIPILLPDSSSLQPGKSKHSINNDQDNIKMQLLPKRKMVADVDWLESNITSIWLNLQHIQKAIKQLRRQHRTDQKTSKSNMREASINEPCPPDWEEDPNACTDSQKLICGGKGKCSCGQCLCDPPYYGRHCQCDDTVCKSYGGVLCGGAGRGQCRCGACACRPDYTGNACECSMSTSECRKGNGRICNGKGECVCNRCQCQDGYTGKFCDESIYSASICERLKPCVLCNAYGKKYPQCEECNINVQIVDKLVSSIATCFMVNLGCVLNYAYITPKTEGEAMTVLVSRDRTCP